MSVYLFSDDHIPHSRPVRRLNQHFGFGMDPDELVSSLIMPQLGRLLHSPSVDGMSWWRAQAEGRNAGPRAHSDKDKFQVNLDVQQFRPDEISVKITDNNTVTVVGKHEEKQDEHGYISRQFVRRYVLSKDHDINRVESKLSSDGVLTITAPKIQSADDFVKSIPIQQTGQPSKAVQSKETEEDEEMKK